MKVLANKHLYRFKEFFPASVNVDLFDPSSFPNHATEYDALFINTTTSINKNTLPKAGNLKFIATGSAGSDHVEKELLRNLDIHFSDASGCNAQSVAEYVITALILRAEKKGTSVTDLSVGVVGCGNTGGALTKLLDKLSIPHIDYDPPRQLRDSTFKSAHFGELLDCNVLSFHVPLIKTGEHPTYYLLNSSWFPNKNFDMVINTSRGGVVDEDVLMDELASGRLNSAVIDVWENEPQFNNRLAELATFATPHIAGYSHQSKMQATKIIIHKFCDFFDLAKPKEPKPIQKRAIISADVKTIGQTLTQLHPIQNYHLAMKSLAVNNSEFRGIEFSKLRTEMPLRHEFNHIRIQKKWLKKFPILSTLGIQSD